MRRQILFFLLVAVVAQAQSGSGGIVIEPNTNAPEIIIGQPPNQRGGGTQRSQSPQNYYYQKPTKADRAWSYPFAGLSILVTNVGVIESFIKESNDSIYKKSNSNEFGMGLVANLDFPLPGDRSSFRARAGYLRVETRPTTNLQSTYSGGDLEDTESNIYLSFSYRMAAFDDWGLGATWVGLGGQLQYVFASSRGSGGTGAQGSNLLQSYGLSPIISGGADYPFTSYSDFTMEVDYLPWKGVNLLFGIRSRI